MIINCLAIDDEPLALDVISNHVSKIPFLNLTACVQSAFESLELLCVNKIDLIFLDIQMPELTGFELINSISRKPMVIFTTAYPNFAIESYEVAAIDYLVKPIPFHRFLIAVNKAKDRINSSPENLTQVVNTVSGERIDEYIFVKSEYRSVKIFLSEILFVESVKDYVAFHCKDKKILSLLNIKDVETQLPSNKFMRIHRSFIVSMDKIEAIERNLVHIGKTTIAVGENFREQFFELVNNKRID